MPITAIIGSAGQANSITLKTGTVVSPGSNSLLVEDVDIGVEDPNRWIIVSFSWKKSVQYDSSTSTFVYIDGVEMTSIDPGFYEKYEFGVGTASVGLFYLNWPTGSTADFTFTVNNFSSTVSSMGYGIYVVYNLDNTTIVGGENNSGTISMNVPSGGFGVLAGVSHNGDASGAFSGTDTTSAYSGQGGSGAYRTVSGNQSHSISGGDVTVSVIGEYL